MSSNDQKFINDELISSFGLGDISDDERASIKGRFRSTLELNVGMKLRDGLSKEQMDEFIAITDAELRQEWIAKVKPDFKDVVNNERKKLKSSVIEYGLEVLDK